MARLAPLERTGIALAVLLLVVLPTALHGWPTTLPGNLFAALVAGAGLALVGWRRPRTASVTALGLLLAASAVGGYFPDSALPIYSVAFAVLALGWSRRAAWVVAACGAAYVLAFSVLTAMDSWVAAIIFTLPPFATGTALRLRRETADELAARLLELEEERELFAEIALRHERTRIASELHDIVGHAISVMVIQAAAGQRLVDAEPERARAAFAAISESARQGSLDLERLIDLLSRSDGLDDGGLEGGAPDLSVVDEVVTRASRSGLSVSCRFDGDRDRVPAPVAHLAFRVVQESLTNALRYAPGADVRIVISVDDCDRGLAVRVENDAGEQRGGSLIGTGRGLIGLRQRIRRVGGQFSAGATGAGGWVVEARLPGPV
ncbi:sensor histidine kinase [uncultured Friedmanniella sp.]|uniref:sensor histidine kinase n=1 Tax=uncultured Friedmanniella sp. TaxID=335381 RepID=UPI0035CC949E